MNHSLLSTLEVHYTVFNKFFSSYPGDSKVKMNSYYHKIIESININKQKLSAFLIKCLFSLLWKYIFNFLIEKSRKMKQKMWIKNIKKNWKFRSLTRKSQNVCPRIEENGHTAFLRRFILCMKQETYRSHYIFYFKLLFWCSVDMTWVPIVYYRVNMFK